MSLFSTKEWWRTECGPSESYDGRSLLVAPLFGAECKDVVVVGSHAGFLRIYSPSSQWVDETKAPTGYKPTDLIIEAKLGRCIIDAKAGRFVSGSQDLRLAVLMPTKLAVYNATLRKGSMDHGDRCDLEVVYEHALPRFPASLTCGPFGGVRGRDFLCVQCLDGTLVFYEQETYAFTHALGNRLLPEPIVYVQHNDAFVTSNSAWVLECYRYQSMAEFSRNQDRPGSESGKCLEPDWSYNIGEAVLGIDIVTLSSFEIGIVVLGEKNLYCLNHNCATLKYAKRLEYKALCFRAYVIEPDGRLMVLVIADTSTLMIYEGTTLKWSAQLPFAPISVARARFQHLDGAVVILSDDGRLEVCYLGSEPSLFIAPPVHRRGYDYEAAEQELLEIRRTLKKNKATGDSPSGTAVDTELIVSVNVSPNLVPFLPNDKEDARDDADLRPPMCKVVVELSSYTTLHDVQVCIDVSKPLVSTEKSRTISNLCDRQSIQTMIYIDNDLPPSSSEVKVTVTYETDSGDVRVLQKTGQLPLRMFLRACPPENTSTFTATIKCNESLVGFNQLFPEFVGENLQKQNSNALGLQHVQRGTVVTIVCGATSNRYRVQSNDGLSMTLVMQQLVNRLKDKSKGGVATSIGQHHVQLVHSQMDAHFHSRLEIERITSAIGLLTSQLRNIERRMLRVVRERNSRSLADTGLPFLLDSTYEAIFESLDELAAAKLERERTGLGLRCALRLLLLLLRLNVNDDKYAILEATIGFEPQPCNSANWEEVVDVALSAFLRSTSRKSVNADPKPTEMARFASTKDLAKLKKRLAHAVERLDSCRETNIAENDGQDDSNVASA